MNKNAADVFLIKSRFVSVFTVIADGNKRM